tara:strand:- start:533 stop:775 length:243 start_codon:yes stop_codon:yes gene_type:complete
MVVQMVVYWAVRKVVRLEAQMVAWLVVWMVMRLGGLLEVQLVFFPLLRPLAVAGKLELLEVRAVVLRQQAHHLLAAYYFE